jgi:YEATS domain-containing protein 4
MVGGKDDISHFIKRVQIKLHETYPQSTRSEYLFFFLISNMSNAKVVHFSTDIDRPPFQVTETGWGEFDIMIRIMFVPESGEKPLTVYHRLKLHPWHPVTLRAPEVAPTIAAEPSAIEQETQPEEAAIPVSSDADADTSIQVEANPEAEKPSFISPSQARLDQTDAAGTIVKQPPVVHSWLYDEIVFPEPTEAFYEILVANPPTP